MSKRQSEEKMALAQQKYKVVIFDVFGVLAEDGWGLIDSTYRPTDAQWAEMSELSHAADRGLVSLSELQTGFAGVLNVSAKEIADVISSQKKNLKLLGYVEELRNTGYKIGMISNVARGFIQDYFSKDELKLFNDVILSGEVGIVKPDPRIYRMAANQLGVAEEECIFVDDNQRNTAGAEAVGMGSILYVDYDSFTEQIKILLS